MKACRRRCGTAVIAMLVLIATVAAPAFADGEAWPPFRVVVDDNHPPFSFHRTDGQADGVSVHVIAALLADRKPPVSIESMPWRRIVLMARTTPNLVIASVMKLPERRDQFIWLGSLFREPISLYALRSRQLLVRQPEALQTLLP